MGQEKQISTETPVRLERRNGVLVIRLVAPPTNALDPHMRQSLALALDALASESDLQAAVLIGASGVFATGGGSAMPSDEAAGDETLPELAEICDRIETSEKPVIAAIDGAALGGGLELALAAHVRIGSEAARLGAPDITLGLVPNAGGTQRLPKVIGGVAALNMLLSGRAIGATAARKLGLLDEVARGDLERLALRQAKRMMRDGDPLQRSSERRDRLGEESRFLEAIQAQRKTAETIPLEAPMRMIECVEASLLVPYKIGRGMEEAAYEKLSRSDHARSLRHVFAAERQMKINTNWQGKVPPREFNRVAVIGASGSAAEVAMLCLDCGLQVLLVDTDEAALETGVSRIIGLFDGRISSGMMTESAVETVLDRLQTVAGFSLLETADIVIDPSPVLTRARLSALDSAMRAGAVLVVGSERISLETLAALTERESDVVGMRFASGLKKNRLVELTSSPETGAKALSTARALARHLHRQVVETAPLPEAVATRLTKALHAAADLSFEDGATVEQIDLALMDWGIPNGSFRARDFLGIDQVGAGDGFEGLRGGGLDDVLVSMGYTGRMAGRGYFLYPDPTKPGVTDPEIAEMIAADRIAKEISPRLLTAGDIRRRCLAAMMGVGAALVEEGVVSRPADIDMIAINGLGFARRTGGVMCPADLVGLEELSAILDAMSRTTKRIAAPPKILREMVEKNQDFDSLNAETLQNLID